MNEQKTEKAAKEQNVEIEEFKSLKFKDYFEEFVPF